jgi:type IV secretory pathway VirB4 component
MLNLLRVIRPWKESDALSAHINLYGYWTETAFLTKSGDLGMVLSVAGVDYESLDNDEQQYAVKRLESALKPSAKASMSTNIFSRRTGLSFRLRPMAMNS